MNVWIISILCLLYASQIALTKALANQFGTEFQDPNVASDQRPQRQSTERKYKPQQCADITQQQPNQIDPEEKKEAQEKEELEKFLAVADWYLDQDDKTFNITEFLQFFNFPFGTPFMRIIMSKLTNAIAADGTKPYPCLPSIDWIQNFDRTNGIVNIELKKKLLDQFAPLANTRALTPDTKEEDLFKLYTTDTDASNYLKQRKLYIDLLQTLNVLFQYPNSTSYYSFTSVCEKYKGFPIGFLFSQLSTLEPNLDRLKLIGHIKATLGDALGSLLIQKACLLSAKPSLEDKHILTKANWLDLIGKIADADENLIKLWLGQLSTNDRLLNDIRHVFSQSKTNSNREIESNIVQHLEMKYYWSTFRAFVDPTENPNDPKSLSRILTYGKQFTHKDGLRGVLMLNPNPNPPGKTVVVQWSVNSAYQRASITKAVAAVRAPDRTNWSNNDDLTDFHTKMGTLASLAGDTGSLLRVKTNAKEIEKLPKRIQSMMNNRYTNNKLSALSRTLNFKKWLPQVAALAKYLGPVASAVSSILSAFYDTGLVNIMEDMRKGFGEMHRRFDGIEEKLSELGTLVQKEIAQQSYNDNVKLILDVLNNTRDTYDRLPHDKKAISDMRSLCSDPAHNPHSLMNQIYKNSLSPTGLPQLLLKWAKDNLTALRQGLLMIVADAMTLSTLYTTVCLPLFTEATPAYKTLTSTKNGFWLANIVDFANRLDDYLLYKWPNDMEQMAKEIVNTNKGKRANELAEKLHQDLTEKYPWNSFHVTVFRNSQSHQTRYVLNPDYSRTFQIEDWEILINWQLQDEEFDGKIEDVQNKFKALVQDRHCTNGIWNAMEEVEVEEKAQKLGIKSVFIRRDDVTPYLPGAGYASKGDMPVVFLVEGGGGRTCNVKSRRKRDGEIRIEDYNQLIGRQYIVRYIFNVGNGY